MTDQEKINVMQAFVDGKEIECASIGLMDPRCWKPCPLPKWDWGSMNYRIKPREPRRRWENEAVCGLFPTFELAKSACPSAKVTEFVEVMK